MHQEEFVYDEIASPREIMLASRNVSYDDQNCRPSYGYSYDNIGNRKTAQEPVGELAYSPYGQAASTGSLVQPVHLWDIKSSNVAELMHTTAGILIIIFLQLISFL